MRLMIMLLGTMMLGGCWVSSQPSFMPAGYTYHQEPYKAPPEKKVEAPSILSDNLKVTSKNAGYND